MLDLKLCSNYSKPATKMLTFDGTGIYGEIPDWEPTGDFVIEGEFSTESIDGYRRIFESNNQTLSLWVSPTIHKLQGRIKYNSGSDKYIAANKIINDGKLHKFVFRKTGDDYGLNVDDETDVVVTQSNSDQASIIRIGLETIGVGNYWEGVIKYIKFTDLAVPSNSRIYKINNGSTSAIGDMTLHNVSESDWDRYYFDKQLNAWVSDSGNIELA